MFNARITKEGQIYAEYPSIPQIVDSTDLIQLGIKNQALEKALFDSSVEVKIIDFNSLEFITIPIVVMPQLTPEQEMELKLAQNTVETLELISALNEIQRLEQAQSNAELIELMMMLGGM